MEIVYNYGFTRTEVNEIKKLIAENKTVINNQLKKFYAGQKVKSINAQKKS